MPARIVVDENVLLAREAFADLGDVRTVSGRALGTDDVRDATALVVRSVTRVDERLLAGSRVAFVGSATIGIDHVDTGFLARAGIAFAHAPGSNARSVAEYVAAALLELEIALDRPWTDRVLGVVGVGHVGALVAEVGRALGMRVLLCDPPRADAEGPAGFTTWEETLERADALTLHTPLTRSGPHPTIRLVGARELERLGPGRALLNTCRGEVVDGGALAEALARDRLGAAVLDVWEGEPSPDLDLVRRAGIATPHIAGYSLDGKLAGTRMVRGALARFLGVPEGDLGPLAVPSPPPPAIEVRATGRSALREAVRGAYPIADDDRRLRAALEGAPASERGAAFDRLRREYPVRREFACRALRAPDLHPAERAALAGLGFAVD